MFLGQLQQFNQGSSQQLKVCDDPWLRVWQGIGQPAEMQNVTERRGQVLEHIWGMSRPGDHRRIATDGCLRIFCRLASLSTMSGIAIKTETV